LADICGHELPTNFQNFMQKDLTKVKIFQKVFGGGATSFETPCTVTNIIANTRQPQNKGVQKTKNKFRYGF